MFATRADLNNVKVGDKVAIRGSGAAMPSRIGIETVTRLTETQVVTDLNRKYYKKDGREVGTADSWSVWYAYEITPEVQGWLDKQAAFDAVGTLVNKIHHTWYTFRCNAENTAFDFNKLAEAYEALKAVLPAEKEDANE